jgi:Uma2 family endonuclease
LKWLEKNRPELVVLSDVSVAMPPNDEPIPDVVLCDMPLGSKGVQVETVHLLIEVADDSRKRDLGYKKALYARQGVPEYWVVDLVKAKVFQFSAPGPEGWTAKAEVAFGAQIEAATLAGMGVETAGLG